MRVQSECFSPDLFLYHIYKNNSAFMITQFEEDDFAFLEIPLVSSITLVP